MFVPFFRLGERFIPSSVGVTINGHSGPFHSFLVCAGLSNIKAIGAWAVVAPFLALMLYWCSLPLFSGRLRGHVKHSRSSSDRSSY
jgi:hypothetical protein